MKVTIVEMKRADEKKLASARLFASLFEEGKVGFYREAVQIKCISSCRNRHSEVDSRIAKW